MICTIHDKLNTRCNCTELAYNEFISKKFVVVLYIIIKFLRRFIIVAVISVFTNLNIWSFRIYRGMFFNSRTILSTVASSTVPRICPTQRASSISTVTCPVKALVEATPISGPTWMYVPESVFLGIEAPTTLQMPYTKAPLLRANCMAATVPSGHTSFVTPYTSQRRSRMPQKEAG